MIRKRYIGIPKAMPSIDPPETKARGLYTSAKLRCSNRVNSNHCWLITVKIWLMTVNDG